VKKEKVFNATGKMKNEIIKKDEEYTGRYREMTPVLTDEEINNILEKQSKENQDNQDNDEDKNKKPELKIVID